MTFTILSEELLIEKISLIVSIFFTITNPQWEWAGVRVMSLLVFFSMGMVICKRGMIHTHIVLRLFEGIIGLIVVFISSVMRYTSIPRIIVFLAGGMVADFVFWVYKQLEKPFDEGGKAILVNVLCCLGRHSLEIYLLHVYFTSGFRIIVSRLFNNSVIAFGLAVIIGIVCPLGISFVLQKLHLWSVFFEPVSILKKMSA